MPINTIKIIEEGIVDILKENLSKQCKIVVDPAIDLSTIKQNIIINLQYVRETFESRSQSKINYSSVQSNRASRSTAEYNLRIFFKELRDSYNKVYDLILELRECLDGQKVVDDQDLSIGPMSIKTIDFIEKTDSGIIRYDLSLSISYISTVAYEEC